MTASVTSKERRRLRRFDSPWLNSELLWGVGILLGIVALGIIGRYLWNIELIFTRSGPLKFPPLGFENLRKQTGIIDHPLGTDGGGRDLLALLIVGAPNTLFVGVLASLIGMGTGIVLGFTAGFVGGRTDDVIRVLSELSRRF